MKNKYFIVMGAIIALAALTSVSYAYLRSERVSSNNTSIVESSLDVILESDITTVNLNNQLPVSDIEGVKGEGVDFKIKNVDRETAKYTVSLANNDVVSTLPHKYVKYQLVKTKSGSSPVTSEIKSLSSDGVLDTGIIAQNEEISYHLVMWLSGELETPNLTFSKNILVEGIQIISLDLSGANYPELTNNMIPIYYDKVSDTTGTWRVADIMNKSESYQWFDYDNYMWANVAVVNKEKVDDYTPSRGEEDTTNLSFEIFTSDEVSSSVSKFTSGNKGVNSTTSKKTFVFTTTSAGKLTFDYSISSETNYDKLTITVNDGSSTTTLVDAISGISSGSKEVTLASGKTYTLIASYSKDSSQHSNDDVATISKIQITSSLSGSMTVTDDATYPWTETTQVEVTTPETKLMTASSYTYDTETGTFTLTSPTLQKYNQSSVGLYTCNSNTRTTCKKLYEIATVDSNNLVTNVVLHQGSDKGEFGSDLGQEVKMEDITSMWVWIPRFKYTVFNGNNGYAQPQLIDIKFEHGKESTGTVTCVDNITGSDNGKSEDCTDSKYTTVKDNFSTYTHPAFKFGDTELTGFWMAKFEAATDQDNSCATSPSSSNCSKTGLNIYSKPGYITLGYSSLSNLFKNIRNMEVKDNIHGFIQDSSSAPAGTGIIEGDSNNFDIHVVKNMEWGAVTYLTYSKYGKYSNNLYDGDYRYVYKNNYYSSYKHTSGKSATGSSYYNASSSTSSLVDYNNMETFGTGKGYKGAGASTTGTVYGVYDMNGGVSEYVMANKLSSSKTFQSSSSGFTSPYPSSEYYDSYNNSSSLSSTKLGDGIKEMSTAAVNSNTSWEKSYRYVYSSYPFVYRGGYAYSSSYNGITLSNYSSASASSYYGTRPTITINREINY